MTVTRIRKRDGRLADFNQEKIAMAIAKAFAATYKPGQEDTARQLAGEVLAIPMGAMGTQLHTAKVTLETTDLFAWTAAIILLSLILEKGAVALVKCLSRRYTPPKKENTPC